MKNPPGNPCKGEGPPEGGSPSFFVSDPPGALRQNTRGPKIFFAIRGPENFFILGKGAPFVVRLPPSVKSCFPERRGGWKKGSFAPLGVKTPFKPHAR